MINKDAWCAGFFDGEGCTYLKTSKKKYSYAYLSIAQKDKRALEQFADFLEVGKIGQYANKDWGIMHRIQMYSQNEVELSLNKMWPYLGTIKKQQAKDVLLKCTSPNKPRIVQDSPQQFNLSWAGGFFSAEGCTWYRKNEKAIILAITQCHLEVLTTFQDIVKMGRIEGPYHWKNTFKPGVFSWQYKTRKTESKKLIQLLYPYLSFAKQEQINGIMKNIV